MLERDYPFTKCLHPRLITNHFTGKKITVSCGHCKPCVLKRSTHYTQLCEFEEASHKYCYLITLTYSNDFVPRLLPWFRPKSNIVDFIDDCDRSPNYCEVVGSTVIKNSNLFNSYLDKLKLNGAIPYAPIRDLQLFYKRLRYYVGKNSREQIRYYGVSEYGPRTFRPHFHVLLFFDSWSVAPLLRQALFKAWKFGHINYSLSRKNVSSYVSSYVNSTACLPHFYTLDCLRARSTHSIRLALDFFKKCREEIYSFTFEDFIKQKRDVFGNVKEFMPWRAFTSFFYPRCPKFSLLSSSELRYSYEILLRVMEFTGYCESASEYVERFTKQIRLFFTDNGRFIANPPNITLKPVERDLLKFLHDDIMCYLQYPKLGKGRLYRLFLCSYHFLYFVCDDWSNFYSRTVAYNRIIDFYKFLDYEHLRKQYEVMEDYQQRSYFDPDTLIYFYDEESNFDKLINSKPYKIYSSNIDIRYSNSIKHKELNDLNGIFTNNL